MWATDCTPQYWLDLFWQTGQQIVKWVCRASESDLSGTKKCDQDHICDNYEFGHGKSVPLLFKVAFPRAVVQYMCCDRSPCRFEKMKCFPMEFYLQKELMHVSNLALRQNFSLLIILSNTTVTKIIKLLSYAWSYPNLQLSISFCSINWSPRWICWSFKSDLSSTTRYHQRDISNICKFGNTKARAKHNLLFNKMASEVVLIITMG